MLFVWNIKTEMRLRKLFRGNKAVGLETIITKAIQTIEAHEERIHAGEKERVVISKQIEHVLRNSVVTHYSAFNDGTAKQSFTIALLNDIGDGVLISSLYARERTSLYAKNIIKGKSTVELTEEEQNTLTVALTKKTI